MARPGRLVVINLALKLGIAPREIGTWSIEDVRDCIAVLLEQNKPAETATKAPYDEASFEARFNSMCG